MLPNDSERPDVDFVRMSDFFIEDFRSNIIWSTANGSSFFSFVFKFSSETEISKLYFFLLSQKQVSELEISVNDFFIVKISRRIMDKKVGST